MTRVVTTNHETVRPFDKLTTQGERDCVFHVNGEVSK